VTFDRSRDTAAPWLYGIATNLLRRHRRSEGRRLRATARLGASTDGGQADEDRVIAAADAEALLPAVAEAVLELPDAERDVLLLFAWEDLTYDDIAAALDVPVGTVRSRLSRARQKVRDLLDAPGEGMTTTEGARRDR
jgi:RNA polymerase sigma-70 factor (ECF subfamily)